MKCDVGNSFMKLWKMSSHTWVAMFRCHQSSNRMQVKNVLRDTIRVVNMVDASKTVTNGHEKPGIVLLFVPNSLSEQNTTHTKAHVFRQRLWRAIFLDSNKTAHHLLSTKHEWNRQIFGWSNPLTTLISLSSLYCCWNWIGCVSRGKKKKFQLIKYIIHFAQYLTSTQPYFATDKILKNK